MQKMNIVNFFVENALNIVIGIGTGIISSIFVSKIFLIYQDVKNDFLEVVKHTTAYKDSYVIYQTYRDPKFPKQYGVELPTNYDASKSDSYYRIGRLAWEELNKLNGIYTKYMDKELRDIMKAHINAICDVHTECDEKKQNDENMKLYLEHLEKVLGKYDSYQKKLFRRTLLLVFTDKLIICLLFVFGVFVFIA